MYITLIFGLAMFSFFSFYSRATIAQIFTSHDVALRAASDFVISGDLQAAISSLSPLGGTTAKAASNLFLADLLARLGGSNTGLNLQMQQVRHVTWHTRSDRLRLPAHVDEISQELRDRLESLTRPVGALPANVLSLGDGIRDLLLVDGSRSRLFFIRQWGDTVFVVGDFFVRLGQQGIRKAREGDRKTPVGAYRVMHTLQAGKVPRYYGPGSWILNYPNDDDREEGRTGSNIWIHGVPPDAAGRMPFATEGCLALQNDDLEVIVGLADPARTLVVVAERVEWLSRKEWQLRRDALLTTDLPLYPSSSVLLGTSQYGAAALRTSIISTNSVEYVRYLDPSSDGTAAFPFLDRLSMGGSLEQAIYMAAPGKFFWSLDERPPVDGTPRPVPIGAVPLRAMTPSLMKIAQRGEMEQRLGLPFRWQ